MRNAIKYGLIGLTGYLVGHYEMKYRIMKVLLESRIEKDTKTKEGEAQ